MPADLAVMCNVLYSNHDLLDTVFIDVASNDAERFIEQPRGCVEHR